MPKVRNNYETLETLKGLLKKKMKMEWLVYYKAGCGWSKRAIDLLTSLNQKSVSFIEVSALTQDEREEIKNSSGMQTWPQIWRNNELIGGYENLHAFIKTLKY